MRRFELENSKGELWDLTSLEVLLYEVSGLGYSLNISSKRVGTQWIITNKELAQKTISGKLMLYSAEESPYDIYNRFVKFISYAPLTIYYTPSKETFMRKVIVSNIEKGELDKYGLHDQTIEFTPLTMWYQTNIYQHTNGAGSPFWSSGVGTHVFPIVWDKEDTGRMAVEINGLLSPPCKITIFGQCKNPVWEHYVDDSLYETGAISESLSSTEHLIIDAINYPPSIQVYDANGNVKRDSYQKSDFSTSRFVELQPGFNKIIVKDENDAIPNYSVETRIEYESV